MYADERQKTKGIRRHVPVKTGMDADGKEMISRCMLEFRASRVCETQDALLSFVQRYNDAYSRANISKQNHNEQTDKPLEIAIHAVVDVIQSGFDIGKPIVHVCVHAFKAVVKLFANRFQHSNTAFDGWYLHCIKSSEGLG